MLENPILRGFNPDPSACKVGEYYYIAVSTFEWLPGVQIYKSKDLSNWENLGGVLKNINLEGIESSGGIWAPSLSYKNGEFYLIYSIVKSWADESVKDIENYIIKSKSIEKGWSSPKYLNSSGFDPSLYHDDDGRGWFLNMIWDYRKPGNSFAGIIIQEYDYKRDELKGEIYKIFSGTEIGLTECPFIFKKNNYYYLMVAEGGTSYKHAVSVVRSKNILGPYNELHPKNPILSSYKYPEIKLQKAGHASMIDIDSNQSYLIHLCGRPITTRGNCILGRETAIQKVIWKEDNWFYLENDKNIPELNISELPRAKNIDEKYYEFKDGISNDFFSLRRTFDEDWISLNEREGYLRLKGEESIASKFKQSLIALKMTHFKCSFETALEFYSDSFLEMAGINIKYDEGNQFYFYVTNCEENSKRILGLIVYNKGKFSNLKNRIYIPDEVKLIYLKAKINFSELEFYYSFEKDKWLKLEGEYDMSIISDEMARIHGFTGAMLGVSCQDLKSRKKKAYFKYILYKVEKNSSREDMSKSTHK